MGLSWLKQHNFVTFLYILTKLVGKMYILLFNSCVIFCARIADIAYQQKSQWLLFVFTL